MLVSTTTCSYPMVSSVSIECGVISGEVIMFSYHGGNVSMSLVKMLRSEVDLLLLYSTDNMCCSNHY